MPAVAHAPKLFAFDVGLTVSHLQSSIERKCLGCAVALAVAECVGAHRLVGVSIDGRIVVKAHATAPHFEAVIDEPGRVAEIVRTVDAGRAEEVAPTVFRIRCPFPPLEDLR
jgi:hypothetical protein